MGRLLLPSQPPEARFGQQEPLRWSRSGRAGEEEQGRQGGGRFGGFSTRSGGGGRPPGALLLQILAGGRRLDELECFTPPPDSKKTMGLDGSGER
nr:unnamed protein product [Digitaria exilis]